MVENDYYSPPQCRGEAVWQRFHFLRREKSLKNGGTAIPGGGIASIRPSAIGPRFTVLSICDIIDLFNIT